MVYGIISVKDNQTSLAFFKSKKVSQGNLVTADRLRQLANVITAGDVVYVVSVQMWNIRFKNRRFVTKCEIELQNGNLGLQLSETSVT